MIKLRKLVYHWFGVCSTVVKALLKKSLNLITKCETKIPGLKRTICAGIAAVSTAALLCHVFSNLGLTYALEVKVNGTSYGCVQSTDEADSAINMIAEQVVSDSSVSETDISTEYNYTFVTDTAIISADELCKDIIDGEDVYVKAPIVFVNDTAFAKCESIDSAKELLASISKSSLFYNSVIAQDCVIDKDMYDNLPKLEDSLELTLPTHIVYEITSKDSYKTVSEKFGISSVLIDALNTSVTFKSGNLINIVADVPAFAIIETKEYDNTYSVRAGVYSKKAGKVTERVLSHSIIGIEYSREVLSTKFVENYAPTAKKVSNAGSYGFCWPVDKAYYHYVSSYWGDGRGHQAVDIAGKVGTPILSAQSGTVESINKYGSAYGKHFVINHGNGIKTLYAHCSTLYVSVGEKVSRGQVVALMGNTGRSTGPHLHFEVWRNGVRVNPCPYLGI